MTRQKFLDLMAVDKKAANGAPPEEEHFSSFPSPFCSTHASLLLVAHLHGR